MTNREKMREVLRLMKDKTLLYRLAREDDVSLIEAAKKWFKYAGMLSGCDTEGLSLIWRRIRRKYCEGSFDTL